MLRLCAGGSAGQCQDRGRADRRAIEVTATAEEPMVSKQARVAEEVVIGKGVAERTETVRDTMRRTEVELEQLGKALARDRRYGKSDWVSLTHYMSG
jgi:stress response protein YsnF